jgi:hypothetical protein
MAAKEKVQVIRAWERFMKSGFAYGAFTQALYHHLIQHCSFIAHFDRGGFYSTYFEDPESTIKFLHQFDADHGYGSVEYGYDTWLMQEDYRDINSVMCAVFEAQKHQVYSAIDRKTHQNDVARAKLLLEKIGMQQLSSQVK